MFAGDGGGSAWCCSGIGREFVSRSSQPLQPGTRMCVSTASVDASAALVALVRLVLPLQPPVLCLREFL